MRKIPLFCLLLLFCHSVLVFAQPYRVDSDPESETEQRIESLVSGDASWEPSIPKMSSEYDWIQLSSGEWLKGELVAMYREELEFDSDELGLLKLDWEDIVVVRTHTSKSLRFESGDIVVGQLLVEGANIRVLNVDSVETFDRLSLVSIANGGESRWNMWDGNFFFGGNLREGNTEQQEYNVDIAIQRRTPSNRVQISYLGNISISKSEETENNHRANVNYDWFLSNSWYLRPLALEAFRDKFQNIERRISYSFQPGYFLIDNSKTTWSVNAGVGYQKTLFLTVEEGEDREKSNEVYALGTAYETEVTDNIDFDLNYDVQAVGEDAGGFLHHFKIGLNVELISNFDLSLIFVRDHVTDPVRNASGVTPEKDDTRISVGISYEF